MRAVLSIVVVAWRSREELLPCVRSIPLRLAQGPEQARGGAVEVVVVDNSPNADGTAEGAVDVGRRHRLLVPRFYGSAGDNPR